VAKSSKAGSKKKKKASAPKKAKARAPRKAAKPKKPAAPRVGVLGYTPGDKTIELRPIREQLQANVQALGNAIGSRQDAQPDLEEALKRMSRWLDDIQDICGPDMAIPLS
jgi:hypothetical protein